MRVYKLQPTAHGESEIERTAFEKDTRKLEPWYQVNGEKQREYAVCPACDNPIQIIGLYEELRHTDRPYGRHTGKRIKGFDYFEPKNFEWCPYIRQNQSRGGNKKRGLEGISLKILGIVLTQFDRMVYIIRKETGIRVSAKIAVAMLESWIKAEGYLFYDATLRNIPWMFAYRSAGLSIYGQQIHADQVDLKQAIRTKIPAARFSESGHITRGPEYYSITWCFVDYQRKMENEDLIETVEFEVCDKNRNVVFSKTITFDPRYFFNLVNFSKDPSKREPELVKKALEIYRKKFGEELTQNIINLVGGFGNEMPESLMKGMMNEAFRSHRNIDPGQ